MIGYLVLANTTINSAITLWFSRDTDIYTVTDVLMTMLCCVLPIIPLCYLYRWCNKFVRGEI